MERKEDPAKRLGICNRLFEFLKKFPFRRPEPVIQGNPTQRDREDTEIPVLFSHQNLDAVEVEDGLTPGETRRDNKEKGSTTAEGKQVTSVRQTQEAKSKGFDINEEAQNFINQRKMNRSQFLSR